MISFEVLTSENFVSLPKSLATRCVGADSEYMEEIANALSSCGDGCEYALSVFSGCILIRVYDGEYFFLFPEPVAEKYDITKAIDALRIYAVKEEIPLIISEVPSELVQETAAMFSNAVCDAEDEQGERFTVRVLSEIMTVEELPTLRGKRILLTALTSEDERVYARLCRDNDTNKYWGYDFAEDNSSPEDSYFLECVVAELTRGTAVSFALKLEGEFVGEAVLYAFDLLGGAECAVRLLPEFRGKGLAVECIELICEAAKYFKLSRLYATVDNRNEPSINLFSKSFLSFEEKDGKTRFLLEM